MTETAATVGDELRERALTDGIHKLECAACAETAWVFDPHGIAQLVTHAVAFHGHRQGIVGVRHVEFIAADTLGHRLGVLV